MKKSKCLSLLLCLMMLLQCVALPVSATETTGSTQETEETVAATQPAATFGTVCIQKGCRTLEGMVPLGGSDQRLDTAQAAFLFEVNTGTVVYSYNPDLKLPAGSLAKIVCAMVAIESCDLDEVVTVVEGIKGYLPSTVSMGLTSHEQVSVRDLLYGLLLESANDAAIALAVHIAGGRASYTTMMNQWLKKNGCTNTEFASVHGIDSGTSVTTARDMAKIVSVAMKNETFMEIFGAATYDVPATNEAEERSLVTTNYFMDKSIIPDYYDTRVKGGIQSYEKNMGASIAVIAEEAGDEEDTSRMKFIGIILGATRVVAENGWSVVIHGNFNEMADLLKYGFNNFKINRIVYDGMTFSQFSVSGGESYAVGQANVNIDSVVPINAYMSNLTMEYTVSGGGLSAPVAKDEMIATVAIKYRSCCLAEAEVFAVSAVKASSDTGVTIRSNAIRSDSDSSGFWSGVGTVCVIVLGLVGVYLAYNSYMRSRMRAKRRKRRAERKRSR